MIIKLFSIYFLSLIEERLLFFNVAERLRCRRTAALGFCVWAFAAVCAAARCSTTYFFLFFYFFTSYKQLFLFFSLSLTSKRLLYWGVISVFVKSFLFLIGFDLATFLLMLVFIPPQYFTVLATSKSLHLWFIVLRTLLLLFRLSTHKFLSTGCLHLSASSFYRPKLVDPTSLLR